MHQRIAQLYQKHIYVVNEFFLVVILELDRDREKGFGSWNN